MANLEESVKELKQTTKIKKIYGILGIPINGVRTVEVPNREGFVYVRLRDNQSELIQAVNSEVSPVYDLPVVLVREGNRYKIEGRDTERYQSWGSFSSFLPRHGEQHSFLEGNGGGGDITWVDGEQFMPMLVMPSGTLGANNVVVSDYRIQDGSSGWIYSGGTGTPNLLMYKPLNGNAVMILVYVDQTTGNPGFLVGSGSYFANTITGSAQVNPYIPAVPNSDYLPAMAVRLSSGTSVIGWDNLYDVRQYYGGSGGGSVSTGSITGIPVQDEGIPVGTGTVFNFVGNNVDVSVSGSVIRVFVTGSSGSSLPTFITGSVPFAGSDGILKENNPKFSFDETRGTLWIGEKYSPPFVTLDNFRLFLRATGSNTTVAMGMVAAGTGSSGVNSPTIVGYRSRGTIETPTPAGNDDILLSIIGAGFDGVQYLNSAAIRLQANAPYITGTYAESRISFEVTPSGTPTRIPKMVLYGDSLNLINSGTYNINGIPHTHNESMSLDGWTEDTNTWTFKNRTQAFTNDPAAGASITLNMADTSDFEVGADVTVSSSAGSEDTFITAVVANTSITVDYLALNHTTTSRLVTLLDVFTINADVTSYIQGGTLLKFTQTTVKYFVVYSAVYASSVTTIKLIHTTDRTLANAAITDTYYSNIAYPDGWPLWFNFKPDPLGWSALPSETIAKYTTLSKIIYIFVLQGQTGGTSNATTLTMASPVFIDPTLSTIVTTNFTAVNNGSQLTTACRSYQLLNSRRISSFTDFASGGWTAANGKRVAYELRGQFTP